MSGLLQDDKGNASTGRVLLIVAAAAGILLLGAGVILLVTNIDGGELCLMTGSGMTMGAVAGKQWQKTVEK